MENLSKMDFETLRLPLNRPDKEVYCAGIDEKYIELEKKENSKDGGENEKECSCYFWWRQQ